MSRFDTSTTVRRLGGESGICLTFDDGPDIHWTPMLLDMLDKYGVKAAFFVVGQQALQQPEWILLMRQAGHDVGSHGFNHVRPRRTRREAARKDVMDGAKAIADITGEPCRWFRPPHGHFNKWMQQTAGELGLTTVLWSHSVMDWGPWGREAWIRRRMEQTASGDIVLLHDGRPEANRPAESQRVLREWLPVARDEGRCFVNLSDGLRPVDRSEESWG